MISSGSIRNTHLIFCHCLQTVARIFRKWAEALREPHRIVELQTNITKLRQQPSKKGRIECSEAALIGNELIDPIWTPFCFATFRSARCVGKALFYWSSYCTRLLVRNAVKCNCVIMYESICICTYIFITWLGFATACLYVIITIMYVCM
jgi:hypothetical protein